LTKGAGSKADANSRQRNDLACDCNNPDKVSEFSIADMTSVCGVEVGDGGRCMANYGLAGG
jgi:hypothetical protein